MSGNHPSNSNSFEIICRAVKKINLQQRRRILYTSSSQLNILESSGLWLYKNHLLVISCLFTLVFLLIYITFFVNTVSSIGLFIEELVFKGIGYSIIIFYAYFIAPAILITEFRFGVSQDERNYFIRNYYLEQTELTISKAKKKLKKDLLSCKRRTLWLYSILSFLYLMIANGLSSGTDFQNALLHLSLDKMYELNMLSTVCIGLSVIILPYWFLKRLIPITWINRTLRTMDIEF